MPYTEPQWVEPDEYIEHAGLTLYHVYEDDELSSGASPYWFTPSLETEGARTDYDVRELAARLAVPWHEDDEATRRVLRLAIDAGLIEAADKED